MPRKNIVLSVEEHSRDSAGMTYVYPVVSRRAGGVSIGINLNPNNACNWKCVYCQVPDLKRGGPPPIDLNLLRRELDGFLDEIESGRFMQEHVPEGVRVIKDIAFSGNGEPTMAKEFPDAIALVADCVRKRPTLEAIKLRVITNGSQVDKLAVRSGLARLAESNGEVWFKFDAGTAEQIADTNGVRVSPAAHLRRLRACAALCPTWVQSCFFVRDGRSPSRADIRTYVAALSSVADAVEGVHLYGIARASMQPEAASLARLPATWFSGLAQQLKDRGLNVTVSP